MKKLRQRKKVTKNMSVNQTSLEAYYNEIIPIRGLRQLEVLKALETLVNASNMMIAAHLGWSINRVTPRINELRKANPPLVIESGVYQCKITNRKVNYWKINPTFMFTKNLRISEGETKNEL